MMAETPLQEAKEVQMLPEEVSKFHHLNVDNGLVEMALKHMEWVGFKPEDFQGKPEAQIRELLVGEYLYRVWKHVGELSSNILSHAQWGFGGSDWFDHRRHLLEPDTQFNDFWAMSADSIVQVLPLDGKVLEFCAGDAFYDYHFYRHRASKIVCVDINPEPYKVYKRYYQAPNIEYHLADVMSFDAGENEYDVTIIRGAIEHFTMENQQKLFKKVLKGLKVGGWFCGDTPANADHDHKMLEAHEFEWDSEEMMRRELVKVFSHVETWSLVSRERTTLFWRCKKIKP